MPADDLIEEKIGLPRIREALLSHVWPGLEMKGGCGLGLDGWEERWHTLLFFSYNP